MLKCSQSDLHSVIIVCKSGVLKVIFVAGSYFGTSFFPFDLRCWPFSAFSGAFPVAGLCTGDGPWTVSSSTAGCGDEWASSSWLQDIKVHETVLSQYSYTTYFFTGGK